MNIVPLSAVANQSVSITLNAQNCQINVYQKRTGMYLDLYVSNVLILAGAACENLRLMVLTAYLGFVGDLVWLDNQGATDPVYTGVGSRYSLIYVSPSDLPAGSIYS